MKSLVVSLHDVSPLTQSRCAKILSDLADLGVYQTSLLVIPNHHGLAPISENRSFQSWLIRQVDAGHEPVLHGYFHQRRMKKADSWISKLTTEIYTAGEGEFFDLSLDEATKSLGDGLSDMAFLTRKVVGFVAPAWLLSDAAEKGVKNMGFVYTTRIGCIRIFKPSKEVKTRSLVWSTRAAWRVVASLGWNKVLAILKSSAPVLRLSIHPADVQHKLIWWEIRKIITAARRKRECLPYELLVERLARKSHKPERS
jgi:predicted deacetylase